MPVHDISEWALAQWMRNWIYEPFCDLSALFASGPAYAYSNLLLVSKRNECVYRLDLLCDQGHPADEARVRLPDAGMRLLGHEREAQHMRKGMRWRRSTAIPLQSTAAPSRPRYSRRLPRPCLRRLGGRACAAIPAQTGRSTGGRTTVAVLLNGAWRGFWDEEEGEFRDLERELVARLAAMSRSGTA